MTIRLLCSPSIDISAGDSNCNPHACTASKIFIFQYSFYGLQLGWFQVITSLKHMGNSAHDDRAERSLPGSLIYMLENRKGGIAYNKVLV